MVIELVNEQIDHMVATSTIYIFPLVASSAEGVTRGASGAEY